MNPSTRARIRDGDPAAFEQLFEDHARVVYRYALRTTGNWATAEDVVSLTFLEAWRLRQKAHPGGDSLLPWLLGVATNVMRNTSRAARRHDGAVARLPAPEAAPDFADGLVGQLADAEELAAARAALSTLRRAEREVFTLCVWEGLSHGEAAQALGIAVGSVRARLSRARARLREHTEAELVRSRMQRSAARGQFINNRINAARPTEKGIR
ncbi:RNA polymerase sigma factor [Streptomyces sp. NPDC051217]|uniref:RNA polymerase sigma factor n=1 Tax=Streptomyces sp. NPDC051217 TaxID=3365644 RepID=UPI0037B9EC77